MALEFVCIQDSSPTCSPCSLKVLSQGITQVVSVNHEHSLEPRTQL